jgi:hypothetical protein
MGSANQFQFTLFKVNLTYLCYCFGRMQLTEQAPHPHPRSYQTYLLYSRPPNDNTLDRFPMLPTSPLHARRTLPGCPSALLLSSSMISPQMGAQVDQWIIPSKLTQGCHTSMYRNIQVNTNKEYYHCSGQ